ncbi:MAG TPA: ABC transporter permease [Patescibacteria group bacterium]|nr:ABC transporter permease [Patescibacteria group bacterium]
MSTAAQAPKPADAETGVGTTAADRFGPSRLGGLASWEALLAVVLLGMVGFGAATSPEFFLTPGNFSNLAAAVMEVAIMALPLTLIIILGEIDLSVESMLGLSSAVLGLLWAAGVPLEVGIPVVLVMGAAGGLLNGLLVARGGLPSLVVTLGTMALFRGLALVVLGPLGISRFPEAFTEFGFGNVPGTPIPWPLVVFTVIAVGLGLVLHRTWIGRQIFAAGKNKDAARYSGVRVQRLKIALFVLSGTIAALAGVILTARFASARADAGMGMTLPAVTMVLLGGVSIFGGRGTIPGVVLAVFTLAVLGNVLRLAAVAAELQSIAIGLLLIVSVAIPSLARQVSSRIDRARRDRLPPVGAAEPGEMSGP